MEKALSLAGGRFSGFTLELSLIHNSEDTKEGHSAPLGMLGAGQTVRWLELGALKTCKYSREICIIS